MAEDIDLFPLFSKVHTCGCLKHFFPRNVHLFSAKLWYDNTLCQGTINLPSFANDCLLKSSCNCILQGDEIIPHPPWDWKTLKTQGKPLKTQGTQFFGIFRILHCEKDVPKKSLSGNNHFELILLDSVCGSYLASTFFRPPLGDKTWLQEIASAAASFEL